MSKYSFNVPNYLHDILETFGSMTRDKLSLFTGIPRTTLYDALVKLQLKDLVEKDIVLNKKRGRPYIKWRAINHANV